MRVGEASSDCPCTIAAMLDWVDRDVWEALKKAYEDHDLVGRCSRRGFTSSTPGVVSGVGGGGENNKA